jgi:hypothetical protein
MTTGTTPRRTPTRPPAAASTTAAATTRAGTPRRRAPRRGGTTGAATTELVHAALTALTPAPEPPTEPSGTPPTAKVTVADGCSAADIARHADLTYSTVVRRLRELAAAGQAVRVVAHDAAAAQPALWRTTTVTVTNANGAANANATATAATAVAATGAPTSVTASPDPAEPGPAAQPGRRRKGQLREEILGVLTRSPGAQFTVGQLAKHLDGASNGAVVNALHTLAARGLAVQTVERPATFRAP